MRHVRLYVVREAHARCAAWPHSLGCATLLQSVQKQGRCPGKAHAVGLSQVPLRQQIRAALQQCHLGLTQLLPRAASLASRSVSVHQAARWLQLCHGASCWLWQWRLPTTCMPICLPPLLTGCLQYVEELLDVTHQDGTQLVATPSWHYEGQAGRPSQMTLREALTQCYDIR